MLVNQITASFRNFLYKGIRKINKNLYFRANAKDSIMVLFTFATESTTAVLGIPLNGYEHPRYLVCLPLSVIRYSSTIPLLLNESPNALITDMVSPVFSNIACRFFSKFCKPFDGQILHSLSSLTQSGICF